MLNLYLMAQLNKEAVLYLVNFDTYTDVYWNIKSASGIYGSLGPGSVQFEIWKMCVVLVRDGPWFRKNSGPGPVLVQKVEILDQTEPGRTT